MPSNRLYLIQNHEEDSYNSTVTSKPPSFTYLTEFGRPHKETKVQNIVAMPISQELIHSLNLLSSRNCASTPGAKFPQQEISGKL